MGLSVALSNALSGMQTTQTGLEVVSRNVANSGTAGYHKQSLVVSAENSGAASSHVVTVGVDRAFDAALQNAYTSQVSDASYSDIVSQFMDRLDTYFGTPGSANALDTQYGNFQTALEQLSTSPDDYSVRAQVVSTAQGLAETLNSLSNSVQGLRQDTESQISQSVTGLNSDLNSLADINNKLQNQALDDASKASLLDQRDRLVASVSEAVDVQAVYRDNGTVSLMTRSGVALVDTRAAQFSFESAGAISATSQVSSDPTQNSVGQLVLKTPSGNSLNVIDQGVLRSGKLAGLIDLRDNQLVDTQNQLDEIASGLATALNTTQQDNATAVSLPAGAGDGYSLDLSDVQKGNSFSFTYSDGSSSHTVKVVRVDDATAPSSLPAEQDGVTTLQLPFGAGVGDVASTLDGLFPDLQISASGNTLQVLDDGTAGTTDVTGLSATVTSPADQGAGMGLNLFVDTGNNPYTNSLDGNGQKLGFAQRISINTAVAQDNELLVKYDSGTSLGDTGRTDYLNTALDQMSFTGTTTAKNGLASFRLSGNVEDLVSQTLSFQSARISSAKSDNDTQQTSLGIIEGRQDDSYGVNLDEEMSRLLELQNAYSASARVVSTVQELIDALMKI